jgi:hypothetical protein
MSVVPLSSPLPLSGNNVDVNYEKDSSSVSSLLLDYTLLNSIIESNQFEKTLEIYSLMLNSCLNDEKKISFEIFINQFIEEYSQSSSTDIKQLIEIFQNSHFLSLISSYDLILTQHKSSSSSSDEKNSSLKKDHVSLNKLHYLFIYLF